MTLSVGFSGSGRDEGPKPSALLLIDVINGFDFESCEGLVQAAEEAASKIAALRERCRQRSIPIVYANVPGGRS